MGSLQIKEETISKIISIMIGMAGIISMNWQKSEMIQMRALGILLQITEVTDLNFKIEKLISK